MKLLNNSSLKYDFWIVLITLVWGSTFFVVKQTVATMDAYLLVFYRNFIAAVVMVAYLLYKDNEAMKNRTSIIYGAVLGFFLSVMYFTQTVGLKYTSSGHSAFIIGSAVVLVPIFLSVFGLEKMNRVVFISVTTVFAGLFIMTYRANGAVNIGDFITVFSALAYAIYIILSGRYVKKSHMFSLITYQFVFSSLFSIIALGLNGGVVSLPQSGQIAPILHLGLGGTLFCYFVTIWVQKYVSSVRMSLLFSLEPVFAVLFAYAIANEGFGLMDLIGGLLIMSGVVFYQWKESRVGGGNITT